MNNTFLVNPVYLQENFKNNSFIIVFSADLLSYSSIVYGNTTTGALVEDFKVRKCSNLALNDTIELRYGKIYTDYENRLSISLDSVKEDS